MDEEDVPHYFCGDCRHWAFRSPCKRLDHGTVKFAHPWFHSYDGGQHSGVICSEFVPKCGRYAEAWPGFSDYWGKYVDQWVPYKNTNRLIYFTLQGDTKIRYGVPLMRYVLGPLVEDGKLRAVEKMYYKQVRSGFGYELVRETIDGVPVVTPQ